MDANKTIGIVGSRRRNSNNDYQLILSALVEVYKAGDKIVSGGCPKGADRFAEQIASEFSIPIIVHLPEWEKYGRGAGIERNGLIAKDADVLIACVAADRTGGTEDTIRKFSKLNKTQLILV